MTIESSSWEVRRLRARKNSSSFYEKVCRQVPDGMEDGNGLAPGPGEPR